MNVVRMTTPCRMFDHMTRSYCYNVSAAVVGADSDTLNVPSSDKVDTDLMTKMEIIT